MDIEKKARSLLAVAYTDAACFSAADKLLRTTYVTDAREVVALRAIAAALRSARSSDVHGWRIEAAPSNLDGEMGIWAVRDGVKYWLEAAP